MSNYKIVADAEEVNNFINWLTPLTKDECFYMTLVSRSKYLKEKIPGWSTTSDRHQCTRLLLDRPEKLLHKLYEMEIPLGSYFRKNIPIPQESLAVYITPNPRNFQVGTHRLFKQLTNNILEGVVCNPVELALSAVHRSKTGNRRIVANFDFDGKHLRPEAILQYVNPEAVSMLSTRGGYHALITLSKIKPEFKNTWFKNISSMEGCDVNVDSMIPIPGTFQGGFVPLLIKPDISSDGKFTGWVR